VYSLRVATRSDLPALTALIAQSVRGLNGGLYTPAEVEGSLIHVFGVNLQLIDDATYYVIESDTDIAAAGGWSARRTLFGGDQLKSAGDDQLDPEREPARIRAFFVHPDHARRGLARRLYEWCADEARAAGFRKLELASTLPGVALYKALGFTSHERIDVPMPGGLVLTCIRMDRSL
jgi:GNAT superfamily N-acetyltransferase